MLQSQVSRRWVVAMTAVLCVILLVVPVAASAQAAIDYLEKKQHALDFYRQNKMVDAVPVLEEPFSLLGFALYSMTLTASTSQEREQLAARARALNRAKQLGDNSELTGLALSGLQRGARPPSRFFLDPEADLSMQQQKLILSKANWLMLSISTKKALSLDPRHMKPTCLSVPATSRRPRHELGV